jgi:hypothetical protein
MMQTDTMMQKYVIAKELVADIVSQAEILKCNVINYANNTCQSFILPSFVIQGYIHRKPRYVYTPRNDTTNISVAITALVKGKQFMLEHVTLHNGAFIEFINAQYNKIDVDYDFCVNYYKNLQWLDGDDKRIYFFLIKDKLFVRVKANIISNIDTLLCINNINNINDFIANIPR